MTAEGCPTRQLPDSWVTDLACAIAAPMARHPRTTLAVCGLLAVQGLAFPGGNSHVLWVVAGVVAGGILSRPGVALRGRRLPMATWLFPIAVLAALFAVEALEADSPLRLGDSQRGSLSWWALGVTVTGIVLTARRGGYPRSALARSLLTLAALVGCLAAILGRTSSWMVETERWAAWVLPTVVAYGGLALLAGGRRSGLLHTAAAIMLAAPEATGLGQPLLGPGIVFLVLVAGRVGCVLSVPIPVLAERGAGLAIRAQRRPWHAAAVGLVVSALLDAAATSAIHVPLWNAMHAIEKSSPSAAVALSRVPRLVPTETLLVLCALFHLSWNVPRVFERAAPWLAVMVGGPLLALLVWINLFASGFAFHLPWEILVVRPEALAPLAVGLWLGRRAIGARFQSRDRLLIALVLVAVPLTAILPPVGTRAFAPLNPSRVPTVCVALSAALVHRLAATSVDPIRVLRAALAVAALLFVTFAIPYEPLAVLPILGVLLPSAVAFTLCISVCRTLRSLTAIPADHPVFTEVAAK